MEEIPEERWCKDSCMRGFHIYKETWAPEEGEMLQCSRETDNVDDRYAVAMMKHGYVVGHVPREVPHVISTPCAIFIRRGGSIYTLRNN